MIIKLCAVLVPSTPHFENFGNNVWCGARKPGARRVDVDLMIDDRLCEIVVCQPNDGEPFYRVVTRRANLGGSLTEAMQEARRLYAATPWPDRRRRTTLN
jgi:hypothetical protein